MSILNNAIASIIIGVEDYKMDDERRLISSTRNIYAGILLLFKHKLVELSPDDSDEVLIKQKILPKLNEDNEIFWIGKGNKTVDTFSIEERFKSLGITVDWKRLKQINEYRNNIEHYYSEESKDSIKKLLSDSFLVIRDFIREYLSEDPKELLGKETYEILLEINEVYVAEKQACLLSLDKYTWISDIVKQAVSDYSCMNCGSDLIEYNKKFICKTCNHTFKDKDLIKKSLYSKYALSFSDYKHGGEDVLFSCMECKEEAFLSFLGQCQICGDVKEHQCSRCGNELEFEVIKSGDSLCYACQHSWDKMMDE